MPEKILNTTKLESYYYHISIKGALDDISTRTIYTLYKCDIDNLSCQKIFYDVYNSIEPVSLRKNEEEKEIYFFRNDNLLFVDGGQPHEILTNKQFGDFIYYLGVYPPYGSSSELEYKYILYKCDLSFVGCRQLPFYYTDTGGNFSLLFDEELKQLKLYKLQFNDENVLNQNVEDDILIYTLDEEPKCYVERCDVPSG